MARTLLSRWRLGLTTAVLVTAVLALGTAALQKHDLEMGRVDREKLLTEALAPLAVDVEMASDIARVEERIATYENAHIGRGTGGLRVLLRDSTGAVVSNPGTFLPETRPTGALYSKVHIASNLLAGGWGSLEVWQTDCTWQDLQNRRWRTWALTLGLGAFCILFCLQVALQVLIARPLERLLDGVTQMERGYWSGLEIPRGAWEMRWLAYRFRNLGSQLEETVKRLVEAERRILERREASPESTIENGQPEGTSGSDSAHPGETEFRRKTLRRFLLSRCRDLEGRSPSDPAARALANEVWVRDVPQAERIGESLLKSRLEDAAFRILEPEGYREVTEGLSRLSSSKPSWLRNRENELKRALRDAGVRPKAIHRRVKHIASIWKKLQSKGLALDQIHDIVAFRILVKTEEECYKALGALHKKFDPLLLRFKDYIAEPKANGYQSLHTCIRSADGLVFEVQIRTLSMHSQAEGGAASHWQYKERSAVAAGIPRGPLRAFRRRFFPRNWEGERPSARP
jgi:hypothetical protein